MTRTTGPHIVGGTPRRSRDGGAVLAEATQPLDVASLRRLAAEPHAEKERLGCDRQVRIGA